MTQSVEAQFRTQFLSNSKEGGTKCRDGYYYQDYFPFLNITADKDVHISDANSITYDYSIQDVTVGKNQ